MLPARGAPVLVDVEVNAVALLQQLALQVGGVHEDVAVIGGCVGMPVFPSLIAAAGCSLAPVPMWSVRRRGWDLPCELLQHFRVPYKEPKLRT